MLLLLINLYFVYTFNINMKNVTKEQNTIQNQISLINETITFMSAYLDVQLDNQQIATIQKQIEILKKISNKLKEYDNKRNALEFKNKKFGDNVQEKDS